MVGESAPLYRQALVDSMHRYREAGPRVAVDESLQKRWPGYQEHLEEVLPGAFEQAVADAATSFAVDVPATLDSRFGDAEARQITQPVLVALGEKSAALHSRFAETSRLSRSSPTTRTPRAARRRRVRSPGVLARRPADRGATRPPRLRGHLVTSISRSVPVSRQAEPDRTSVAPTPADPVASRSGASLARRTRSTLASTSTPLPPGSRPDP